jgi:uncharacterized repeat protein (TIGR03803 family)
VFDPAGNIYGVTIVGGTSGQGTVYELTSGTEKVLYAFSGGADGAQPFAGVIFHTTGKLYGATQTGGGGGFGTVYQLTSSASASGEKTLHSFQGSDGATPVGSLIFDQSGNLYGTTCFGGAGGGGTVFKLTPSSGNWTLSTLHSFTGFDCPWARLTMDAAGNFYGAKVNGGDTQGVCFPSGCGTVYKLARSRDGWTYTDIHVFTGVDGKNPYGHLIFDAAGNLYGTASIGGTGSNCSLGCGVVFEITP